MTRITIPRKIAPLLERIGTLAQAQGVSAYAVGGCVRDWSLRLTETPDVDIVVEGQGTAFAQALADALHATLTVHPAFLTATLALPHGRCRRIDVAGTRRESYARPGAYPKVAPGTLQEDLFRRDFTINAMAVATAPGAMGRLVDLFGGRRDLRARRLRILHPDSFRDDPSRILRGVRFAERFGLRWERRTFRLLRQAVQSGAFGRLNPGRLRRELARMSREPNPIACFRHLARLMDSCHGGQDR